MLLAAKALLIRTLIQARKTSRRRRREPVPVHGYEQIIESVSRAAQMKTSPAHKRRISQIY